MDWLAQYSAALDERDAQEQAHRSYIDAYTRLADVQQRAYRPATPTNATAARSSDNSGPPPEQQQSPGPALSADEIIQLRNDLATTQKARAALQTRVTDLTTTISSVELQRQRAVTNISLLTKQKAEGERRLRDRDEELRGKTKLAETAQDEMVALGLQLHMAEEKAARLETENAELVARWMKKMEEEAERVNRDSKWE